MARGDLVSDQILLGMLESRSSPHADGSINGFILDGYPRNLAQAPRRWTACWRRSASRAGRG